LGVGYRGQGHPEGVLGGPDEGSPCTAAIGLLPRCRADWAFARLIGFCEQGWGAGDRGTGMGWGEHVVQARAREVGSGRRVQGDGATTLVSSSPIGVGGGLGWRRWACTCSRWGGRR